MSSYGRPPPRIDGMVSLKDSHAIEPHHMKEQTFIYQMLLEVHVDNLTYRTTPDDLRRVFERCGEVGDIYIPRDRHTRESRGFAFVRFFDKRDAQDALDAMDGRMLDGRELRVQMARYGRPTSPQRGGGGGGGGRRYGGGRDRGRSRDRHRRRSRSPDRPRGGIRRSYSRSRSRSRDRSRSGSKSSRGKESRSRSPLERAAHY